MKTEAYYVAEQPLDFELSEKVISDYMAENTVKYGDRIYIETNKRSWSFAEADALTDRLAGRLYVRYGLEKGMHAAIWSVNSPDLVFLFLAMMKIGVVPIPLNTCLKEKEVSDILNNMEVKALFYGKGWKDLVYENMIPDIRKASPQVRHFVAMDTMGKEEGGLALSDLSGDEEGEAVLKQVSELKKEVTSADTACIVMTSGTTLSPKGVMLSHYNCINDAIAATREMRWSHADKMLVALPMYHCFGLNTGIICCMIAGITLHILPFFGTRAVWDALERYNCTIMNGVPSIFLALVRKEEYLHRRGYTLRSGIIGGAAIREEEYMEICRHFPNMRLQSSYGMTESSPSVSFVDWDASLEKKAASCGKLLPGLKGRIADIRTGEPLPQGMEGEFQLKGYSVTQGYYNRPEHTKEAFTEDGWLRTGDIGRFDEEGNLYITGRLKELIIRAGENISVREIEVAILDSGMVTSVKVVGVPSAFRQEEIAALVVSAPGASLDPHALMHFLKEKLADYKLPRFIIPVKELPTTGSGKVNLKASQDMAKTLIQSPDAVRYDLEEMRRSENGGNV